MAFGKLNRLDLLAGVHPQAQIPEDVYHEVVTRGLLRNEPDALVIRLFLRRSGWPIIAVADGLLAQIRPFVPLGRGETAVLALAAARALLIAARAAVNSSMLRYVTMRSLLRTVNSPDAMARSMA